MLGLRGRQRIAVDEERLRGRLLNVHGGQDFSRDLLFEVVALVEHEVHAGGGREGAEGDDLVHDAEELEGVGSPHDQVVVSVEARVEVKGSEAASAQQLDDDEFDVGAGRVVAGIEADDGPLTQRGHMREGCAPVRNVGVVERGLEELVLQEEALMWSQILVDNGQ